MIWFLFLMCAGVGAIVLLAGVLVPCLVISEIVWASFAVTLMDAWSCHRAPWHVYVRAFWREVRHNFRQEARIGPWASKSVGGYEVERPFGWPRKIKRNK